MQSTSQAVPLPATSPPALPTGFDGGNGSVKLIVDNAEIRIPSYIASLHNEIYDIPESKEGSLVEYLAGDRSDLVGQRWLAGHPAYQINPLGYSRVVDDRAGKIKYGLHLLLGGLATISHRARWNLSVVASIQDAQAFGTELAQSFKGQHSIRINGKGVSWIDISVSGVVEEGSGAVVSSLLSNLIQPKTQNIFIDLGNGTTIASVFGQSGKLIARKVTPGGVDSLIESISKNINTRRQLMKEADRHLIRAGIEIGSFEYGTTGWNFRDIYNTELKPWVSQSLVTAFKSVDPWREQSDSIVAIGGGSQLPAIAQLLASQKIVVATDGVWMNARGLFRLAQIKGRTV
ncbi:MAG: hypothetical protein AB1589_39980 [Cyanobacteriota bacterium]